MIGVSCTVDGKLLSGFTTSYVGGVFVTVGVLMGVGNAVTFVAVGSIAAYYFVQKRGLANGIIMAGGGVGGAVISCLMNHGERACCSGKELRI